MSAKVNDLEALTAMAQQLLGIRQAWSNPFGFSAEEIEAAYLVGYQYYQAGQYREAERLFHVLVTNSPAERRFLMALAGAHQMLAQYEDAIRFYVCASMLDVDDAVPTFHIAECFLARQMREEAAEGLRTVLLQCERRPDAALRARAQAMLDLLEAPQP
jgi:type III secretion system low calcium response chaperone LcrH/SycD